MLYGDVVEMALYHPEHGFYASGGRAGRRGDFLTSPEVGPLFGHVVTNALDQEWDRLGQPDPFSVIDWGAGPGTLLRSIARAKPRGSGSLRRIAVERSQAQRTLHDDGVESIADLEARHRGGSGVVIANELLDNLAFTPVRIEGGSVFPAIVGLEDDELFRDYATSPIGEPALFSPGATEAIWQPAAADWLTEALDVFEDGRVICFDYARTDSAEVEIRTYAQHGEAGDPLRELGTKDITVDVDFSQLQRGVRTADNSRTQAQWLDEHGIDKLVEEGQQKWKATAQTGSLEAMWARSRIRESEALMDPTGLGNFMVMEWLI